MEFVFLCLWKTSRKIFRGFMCNRCAFHRPVFIVCLTFIAAVSNYRWFWILNGGKRKKNQAILTNLTCLSKHLKENGGTSDSISIWNTDFSVLVDGFNAILFHPKWTPPCQFQTIGQSFATFHSLREFPSQTWISSYFFHHQYLYLCIGVIYDLFSSGGLSSFYLKVLFHGGVAHSKQGKI